MKPSRAAGSDPLQRGASMGAGSRAAAGVAGGNAGTGGNPGGPGAQQPRRGAYRILEGLLAESPWAQRIPHDLHRPRIEPPAFYERQLQSLGFQVDLWETTYQHRLAGPAEIVEWLKGTTLRPVLSALSETGAAEFLAILTPRIRAAYPAGPDGVVFPFRRLFFLARGRG